MFDRFSGNAKAAMVHARGEAKRWGHPYLGTEHMLLGLLREDGGLAADALQKGGLDLDRIRMAVERRLNAEPQEADPNPMPFTPVMQLALRRCEEEAAGLEHDVIGTGHLLLALTRERDGIAAEVLLDFGVHMDDARELVARARIERDESP